MKFSEKGFAIFRDAADEGARVLVEAAEVCLVAEAHVEGADDEGCVTAISMKNGVGLHVLGGFEYVIQELDEA